MAIKLAAVLFDLDGTLADTRDDLHASVNHLRSSFGLEPLSREETVARVGRGVSRLVEAVLPPELRGELARAVEEFRAHYLAHCSERTRPYDGVPEMLADLRDAGVRCGVVTNKPEESARQLVRALDLPVDLVVGAEAGVPTKPDPAPLLHAVAQLGVPLRRTVYVGDLELDLECARRAGCAFVGVDFGFSPGSRLAERTAVCVRSVGALRRALGLRARS